MKRGCFSIRIYFWGLLVAGLGACISAKVHDQTKMTGTFYTSDLPIVRDLAGTEEYKGQRVIVYGTYIDVIARMLRPGEKPEPQGHVGVRLSDGAVVLLYVPGDPEAIRSKTERKKLRGKKVVATGVIYPYVPIEGNAPKGPCLVKIERIERVRE